MQASWPLVATKICKFNTWIVKCWIPRLYACNIRPAVPKLSLYATLERLIDHGTLPWNINIWKSKDPQSPRTLRLCMSEDLCKNYYSHLYFTVVTFLTKIQNWYYITKNNLSKHNCQKSWMVKTTTFQKIWMGKTIPEQNSKLY